MLRHSRPHHSSLAALGFTLLLSFGRPVWGASGGFRPALGDLQGFFQALRDPARHYRVPVSGAILRRTAPLRESTAMMPERFSVLLWNLQKGSAEATRTDLQTRAELREADLHLFQEFRGDEKWNHLLQTALEKEWWVAAHFYNGDGQPTGLATGATSNALETTAVASQAREPVSRTPKMHLFSSYALAGRAERLGVINVHAINFVTLAAFEAQMREVLKSALTHAGPLLVAGDFNTWSKRRFRLLVALMHEGGLTNVPLDPSRPAQGLDHIFVRGLRVDALEVLRDFKSSDHAPVRFTLSAE